MVAVVVVVVVVVLFSLYIVARLFESFVGTRRAKTNHELLLRETIVNRGQNIVGKNREIYRFLCVP